MTEPLRDDAAAADRTTEQDFAPSMRFRIVFTAAMLLIALGYTWVWRAKTERVVAEPPPILALSGAASYITREGEGEGEGEGDDASGNALLRQLRAIPGLTVLDARGGRPAEPEIAQLLTAELRADGARQVLELRRSDAKSGGVLYVHRVEGATLEEVVYRMSVQIAMSFGLPWPERPGGGPAR